MSLKQNFRNTTYSFKAENLFLAVIKILFAMEITKNLNYFDNGIRKI